MASYARSRFARAASSSASRLALARSCFCMLRIAESSSAFSFADLVRLILKSGGTVTAESPPAAAASAAASWLGDSSPSLPALSIVVPSGGATTEGDAPKGAGLPLPAPLLDAPLLGSPRPLRSTAAGAKPPAPLPVPADMPLARSLLRGSEIIPKK